MEYGNMDKAVAGLKFGLQHEEVSRSANRKIDFGDPIFLNLGDEEIAGDGTVDAGSIVLSANLITGNSTVVTINGVAQTAVVFATDHATTFAAIVATIVAAGVNVESSSATTRTISMRTTGVALTVSAVTTLGDTQPTWTYTATVPQFFGVASATQKWPGYYDIGDTVNIVRDGLIWVPVADAVGSQAQAYVTSAGAWTDESSGNTATGCRFRMGTTAAGLALLEVIKKAA